MVYFVGSTLQIVYHIIKSVSLNVYAVAIGQIANKTNIFIDFSAHNFINNFYIQVFVNITDVKLEFCTGSNVLLNGFVINKVRKMHFAWFSLSQEFSIFIFSRIHKVA